MEAVKEQLHANFASVEVTSGQFQVTVALMSKKGPIK
jgi:hypothetical protein